LKVLCTLHVSILEIPQGIVEIVETQLPIIDIGNFKVTLRQAGVKEMFQEYLI